MKSTHTRTITAAALIGALAFSLPAALAASSCCGARATAAENNPHAAHGHGTKASASVDALSAQVMESYFAIQTALAADSLDGVSKHAKKLHAATGLESAGKIADTADIADARKSFAQLSEHLIDTARKQGMAHDEVRLAHCPMAFSNEGASWLQAAGTPLANPYFGASMLRCGEFLKL